MPPSRFGSLSPWRNLASKPLPSYSELNLSLSDVGRSVAVSPSNAFIRGGGSTASLVVLSTDEDAAGKYAGREVEVITLPTAGHVSDLEWSAINQGRLAVGTEDGSVVVLDPSASSTPRHWKHAQDVSASALVRWHPHASELLLTASVGSPVVALWDVTSAKQVAAVTLSPGPKAPRNSYLTDVTWSNDGKQVYVAVSDGTVQAFDPRGSPEPLSTTAAPMGIPKPLRLTATGNYLLASTLNASRQRELRIYGHESIKTPIQVITLDTASHPLVLTATDRDRNIVFMASKGDVTMRWIELDDARKFPQGAFPLPPRTTFQAAALLPPVGLDVMKAEIDRVYVTSNSGELVPIRIEIPQRQLIDYHPHLFPDTSGDVAPLTVSEWVAGKDALVQKLSLDPAKRAQWGVVGGTAAPASSNPGAVKEKEAVIASETPASKPQPVPASQVTASQPASQAQADKQPTKVPEKVAQQAEGQVAQQSASQAGSQQTPVSAARDESAPAAPHLTATNSTPNHHAHTPLAPAPAPAPVARPVPASSTKAQTQSIAPSHSSWSRTTLTGVTPLLSAFTSVPAFDSSVAPSASSLLATPSHILYPLAGPGGRLAFHEITRQGRLPEAKDVSWIETGGKVLDFAYDLFDDSRVATGGEDGVKVWQLPVVANKLQSGGEITASPSEYTQQIVSQAVQTIAVPQVGGRASKVAFHPTARDVLLVAGTEGVAVVDLRAASVVETLTEPTSNEAEWSPDGSLVAFARSSDRKLVIWDPRSGATSAIAAHESSPRPFKICWTDDRTHVVTVGHAAGSMRQVKLFAINEADLTLREIGRTSLDTSPAILFPIYDPDTSILYLWSKGERSVSALQLTLNAPKPKFGAAPPLFKPLPAFQHSTPQVGISFIPKRYVNVREVEVAIAYRLARNNEIQRVTWKVERKRKEFFQDDVYPSTRDVEQSVYSGHDDWSSSTRGDVALPMLDLRPTDLQPLSTAPPPETKSTLLPRGPSERFLTDKEREDELMNSVFDKAKKGRGEEDDLEDTAARRRAPDDDDWDD